MAKKKEQLTIHYQKNPLFRSVYADGAIGGLTPQGKFNLNFYATRSPIPKAIEYKVNEKGLISDNEAKVIESKYGLIREIEFSVYLDRHTAQDLYEFLKTQIEDGK